TDRDKTIILADAYKQAERIRGEGDAKAVEVYAEAYSADPKFYEFVRTLDSYKKIIDDKTMLVLPSDSRLFKLLLSK
ncbi:MAG: protease modulator HflC, partial [Candidatus Marinimicrobia bacterium]|nr:protease modulator HflC [Candidatus Neomarinimicrobiota bacterium]